MVTEMFFSPRRLHPLDGEWGGVDPTLQEVSAVSASFPTAQVTPSRISGPCSFTTSPVLVWRHAGVETS